MKVPAHIFREYDIRGFGDEELTDPVTHAIGQAFGSVLVKEGKKKISVCYDLRKSSKRIQTALIAGLTSAGIEVLDLGLIPTPLVYFSVSYLKLDGGISVTGSHNPPEYNGFKLHLADRPFYGREIQELKTRIEKEDYVSGKGTVRKGEIIEDYKKYVKGLLRFRRRLQVVVDAGHGMAGLVAPDLIRSLGHEVIELYTNLDSDFPDHHPDPSVPANLADLQKKVVETQADVGIGFDGDADRIGVVDEKGQIIFGDKILLLYARAILKKKPGATIIGDVKCSQQIYDDIAKRGGYPIMWKTGHSLIKAKMKEVNAALAGEMSGHMFFKDRWFGFDDAIYAACRMLELIDEENILLSKHLEDLPPMVSTPEIRVECPDDIKFKLIERAVQEFQKEYKVITTDGARIQFPDGWGLVRVSNTQPVLVMRFEAVSGPRLTEIRAIIENKIKALRREF
ncbi:MAG: phosphomannomutase/phosphoglucomutase [Candidatus Omnitrophica bacterium]|nr:phosphomannomutase/phosphoglucomutase [Candidatus Omnitrophota bacterium]